MRTPLATLVCLLASAVITLVGGMRLARRELVERHPADRRLLHRFTEAFQEELVRLDDVYERDLAETVGNLTDDQPHAVREQCARLCGVAACVLLPAQRRGIPPTVIKTASAFPAPLPEVMLLGDKESPDARKAEAFYLRAAQLNRPDPYGTPHGWLSSAGSAYRAYWWRRDSSQVVVLVLDWQAIQRRTNEHLTQWAGAAFSEVRSSGEAAAVTGLDEVPLLKAGETPERPADVILPVRNRFGGWQVRAWERMTARATYDSRLLTLTAAISGVLTLLAVILYREQTRAQVLAEQRVSFVNRVSHELGTPLTNMLLNLDLAGEAVASAPEQARRRLGLAVEETRRLARLVSNVLVFSRKERGVLRLHPGMTVPDNVVQNVIAQFEPALARRGIQVEFQAEAAGGALLDADALAQIVGNLISNVEKYAADGKWLGIRTALENGALRIHVEDRGPGIPDRERDRIFLPFHRVRSGVNEGASGTGLGLAIARDLAESMGGRIMLLETGGQGCAFELSLPVKAGLVPVEEAGRSAA